MRRALATTVILAALACKPPSGPIVDADSGSLVEAGVGTVNDICSLIEGITQSGAVYSICATVEEIANIVAFILTLRSGDAGVPSAACLNLPGTTFCATSAERAQGILFTVRARQVRATLDAGAR